MYMPQCAVAEPMSVVHDIQLRLCTPVVAALVSSLEMLPAMQAVMWQENIVADMLGSTGLLCCIE